jgi:glycosyltransferase involved in cell wall biosynthesis
MKNTIYLVLPCYNEQEVLQSSAAKLLALMNKLIQKHSISEGSKIYFINDGSYDNTWNIIEALHEKNPIFCGISLAHNVGHQNALLAGLLELRNKADAIITLDVDLQDDIAVIPEMLRKFYEGNDIVYGVRNNRDVDAKYISWTANFFYKFMNYLGVNLVYNHADYRLMSRRAINALSSYHEVNLFLRGLVPLIGMKSDKVYYKRKKRFAGITKYPFAKRISFALEGITSFSIRPVRFITFLGLFSFFISASALLFSLISYFYFRNKVVTGWTSIFFSLWAIGGLILLSIGLIGEYIGKIYLETKRRPRYLVDEFLD